MNSYPYISSIERRVSGVVSAGQWPVFDAVAVINGKPTFVYLKFVEGRGAFNELFVSRLGESLQLPTAKVYPCACPGKLLQGEGLNFDIDTSGYHYGVVSVAADKVKWGSMREAAARLEFELMNWPQLAAAAVFDELVANDDRNVQNILKIKKAKNKFILIDHEQCLGGDVSLQKTDFMMPVGGNFLANLVFESGHDLTIERLFKSADEVTKKILAVDRGWLSDVDSQSKIESGSSEYVLESLRSKSLNLKHQLIRHDGPRQLFAGLS